MQLIRASSFHRSNLFGGDGRLSVFFLIFTEPPGADLGGRNVEAIEAQVLVVEVLADVEIVPR